MLGSQSVRHSSATEQQKHNKCDVLESSPKLPLSLWKNCLPWKQSLIPKRLGTAGKPFHPFCIRHTCHIPAFHIGSFQSSFHIDISLSYQVVVSVEGDVEMSRGEPPKRCISSLWIHTRKVSDGEGGFYYRESDILKQYRTLYSNTLN